jgi:PPK2 family polyphosphate:nucleotide phosphotransferase
MQLTHLIKPGDHARLDGIDPADTHGIGKDQAEDRIKELGKELCDLQELLYAAGTHGVLIVLQGRDCAGKDGAIRNLLNFLNAQGTTVAPFKVPTPKELAHDFLWRVHAVAPGRGDCVIFNRSHYEDVLVVRVHELVPESVWKRRYEHINAFEQLLIDSNIIVLKFMLHISKDEQEERLLDRERETEKAWKLSANDWKERERWGDYSKAYEDALEKCSTEAAPWHVIAADRKWFRDLAITQTIVEALRPLRAGWMEHLRAVGERAESELKAYRDSISAT